MRLKQDLSIALVLAVVGSGLASPSFARGERQEAERPIDAAMRDTQLTPEEERRVRELVGLARDLQGRGDEDGSASAMAAALEILRAA